MKKSSDAWRKRLALQVAQQLPDDTEDAIAVLSYAIELVNGFLAVSDKNCPQDSGVAHARVVELPLSPKAPNRFASSSGSPAALPK